MNKKIRLMHEYFDKHVPVLFTAYDDKYVGYVKLYKCECKLWFGIQMEGREITKCQGETPCCVIEQYYKLLNHWERKAMMDQFMRLGIDIQQLGIVI